MAHGRTVVAGPPPEVLTAPILSDVCEYPIDVIDADGETVVLPRVPSPARRAPVFAESPR